MRHAFRRDLILQVEERLAHYLLFLNRLSRCEREFSKALLPQFKDNAVGAAGVMKKMEVASEKIHRERVARIFP